jgi:hypothetical protein
MVSVNTTTGVPRYGYIVLPGESGKTRQEFARWEDNPEFFSEKFEVPLATLQRLDGLGPGGKQSRDSEAQIMQRIGRKDPTRTDDPAGGQSIH